MAEISTTSYTIRYALPTDITQILQLIQELAAYENALHEVLATESLLRQTLSFPKSPGSDEFTTGFAKTLLISPADDTKSIAGMALYFHNYSTWTAAPGIYLEDLFVRPQYRKRGFGKALFQALGRECVRLGCRRLDWWVLKWNKPSIDFYESNVINGRQMEEWMPMRVDGEGLEKLARSES